MQFNIDTSIPGPGAYMPPSTFALNAKVIKIKPRAPDPKPAQVPGPMTYTPSKSGKQKTCTIGVRYKARRNSPAPSPLTYNVPEQRQAKCAIIGVKCFREKKIEPTPSAQDYDPKPVQVYRELLIGQRHEQKVEQTPGPAEYCIDVNKPNGGHIHERLGQAKPQNPEIGPGKYYHEQKFSEGGFTFQGRSKRYWRLE